MPFERQVAVLFHYLLLEGTIFECSYKEMALIIIEHWSKLLDEWHLFIHFRYLCNINQSFKETSIMSKSKNWTREEIIVALNLYCKIPFKNSRASHPLVKQYAQLIGRTPAALNLKIGNLGRLDPTLRAKGITGLSNGSKLDVLVWNEFIANPNALAFESEQIIAQYKQQDIETSNHIDKKSLPEGKERLAVVRQRVNQNFFRDAVLTSYNYQCCISGVSDQSLLEACHISSWKDDPNNRTNPCNGLCLNSFFHKAFDNFLFAVTPYYLIDISEKLLDTTEDGAFKDYLAGINNKTIHLPDRFLPDAKLIEQHYERYNSLKSSLP